MRKEIKILFNFFIIGLFVIPLLSIITSHFTFKYLKPKTQNLRLRPTIEGTNIKISQKLTVKERSAVYLVITVPETRNNFDRHTFFVKTNQKRTLFYRMGHRPGTHLFIDSLIFFPLIKLGLYNSVQVLREEVGVLGDFDDVLTFEVKNEMHFDDFHLDILEEANRFKMFIYHHEMLYKCVMSGMLFGLSFTIVIYLVIFIYKQVGRTTQEEIQEIIEGEFIKG